MQYPCVLSSTKSRPHLSICVDLVKGRMEFVSDREFDQGLTCKDLIRKATVVLFLHCVFAPLPVQLAE